MTEVQSDNRSDNVVDTAISPVKKKKLALHLKSRMKDNMTHNVIVRLW